MYMYKKWGCLISIVLLLGIVGNASAVDRDWTNGSGDRLWRNPVNWSGGAVPTLSDKAAIRNSGIGPIIDASTSGQALQVVLSDWSSFGDYIDMTGGTLLVSDWFIIGYGAANDGTLNISAGTISGGTDLYVGFNGTGTINMTGGSITVANTFGIAQQTGGAGDVFLDGGTISSGSFNMTSGAAMDITEGTLIVNGDVTSTINGYISNGWLTAYDGSGTLNVDYGVTNPGKTTVTASTPEKASYPSPANGAGGVDINADLSWTAGIYAVSHDVYFGTDPTPDETEFIRNQPETTYNPGTMELNTTYYWRIDEVNEAHPSSPWTGDVWSFETYSGTATLKKGPYIIYPGDNTKMQVLWQLDESMPCTIEWGTDTTYSDGSANTSEYDTDHQHKHTIPGLTPGTKYFYKVTVGTLYETGSFRAAPPATATNLKFLVYGDTRTYPSIHDMVCDAIVNTFETDPDYQTILLHDGDFVNAGLTEASWATEFFDPAQVNTHKMLGNIPLNGAQGNHERQVNGGQNEGWLYLKYWPYPYVGGYYWSYDYGPAHIAVVDEYIDYSTGSAQRIWLENDLANTTKEWKFIISHDPGWSAGGHPDNTDIQTYIHPLCVTYDVDIYFAGHNHYYARCGVDGIKYITTGGGGAPLSSPDPEYTQYVEACLQANHFCKIDIVGTDLTFNAVKPDGTVIDTFALSHGAPPLPGQATNPSPADGATNVSVDADLSWTAGDYADSHDVYFGTNPTPGAGEFIRNQTETTYNPGTMAINTTYYWRIDEKNETGTTTGDVWSFTTESPCVASTTHVESIVCGTLRLNPPKLYGQVTVTIYDNCGDPVAGADVTGTFTGDFNEQLTETTNGNGVAVITTTTDVKKPSYTFCVDSVTHATLTYDPNDNVETCCSY